AFQRFIRAISGLLTQADVLPSATGAQLHYDKRFDHVEDIRAHMRDLVDESRTAIHAATQLATKLKRDARRISGPIANDIGRIPEQHLASVFTMILKAGLKGFCPDVDGPVHSKYNQFHRHLAVSGFQFLAELFALAALEVDVRVAANTELLGDMYDNYTYGTLARGTKQERRRPGSLKVSLKNGVESKALTRVDQSLRQPKKRVRGDPLAPASEIGMILPLGVPIDFFTPEFYNALTVKERARYANTGVAFPLADFAFDEVHEEWKTMGKKEFMAMYGDDVLDRYDVPTPEEIAAIPDSDAEDDEDIEINLADTDDDEEG
ncbi:hypothetical protein DFH09DRAFT_865099, partial [Mycena vulgaris]